MPGRSRSRFRTRVRVPAVVLVACLAFGSLAALWSVVAPLGEAPDEPAHLGLVLHLAAGGGYPSYDGLHNPAATLRLCSTYAAATRACPRPGEPVTATSTRLHPRADAPPKATRPAWDDAGGSVALGQLDQMPQHPPLYYEAMAAVLRVERGVQGHPWSLDRELALLRLVNAVLLLPLPALAWWAAKRIGLDHLTAVTAAVATLGLPMLTHIGSTLNNDNLLTLCGAVLAALLAGVARGDRSPRTAVALGIVTGLALLTKAFAVLFPVAIVAAYVVGALGPPAPAGADGAGARRRTWPARLRSVVPPVAVVAGLSALLAGWWYVDIRVRTGRFGPTIEDRVLTTALRPAGFHARLGPFLAEFLRSLDQRFWGSFGWYTVRLSTGLTYALTAVVVAAVVSGLAPRRRAGASEADDGPAPGAAVPTPPRPGVLALATLLVPVVLLGLFVLQHAWGLHVRTSKYQFIQGRYLLAGITGLTVVAAAGVRRWVGRWAPLAVTLAGGALQAWALHRALTGWWGGPGVGPSGQVRALVAWSGWPGPLVGVIVVVAAAAGLGLLVAVVAERRGPGPGGGRPVGSVDP